MPDVTGALGLASRGDNDRLSVWLVEVTVDIDGLVRVAVLEPWKGTRGRDDASQLIDVHDAVVNALDSPRLGAVDVVAVKRVESPRGRPSKPYDRRVRFEAAAMLAASGKGRRYFGFRSNQLGPGHELAARARAANGAPTDGEGLEAVDAACAALGHLG